MVEITVNNGTHPYADNVYRKELRKGTVDRDKVCWGTRDDLETLKVEGNFLATLEYDFWEQGRSSVTLWYKVEGVRFILPEDHDRYQEVPRIRYAPMRFAEFEKMMQQKNLLNGGVTGTFRFNKKGPSISLELVR